MLHELRQWQEELAFGWTRDVWMAVQDSAQKRCTRTLAPNHKDWRAIKASGLLSGIFSPELQASCSSPQHLSDSPQPVWTSHALSQPLHVAEHDHRAVCARRCTGHRRSRNGKVAPYCASKPLFEHTYPAKHQAGGPTPAQRCRQALHLSAIRRQPLSIHLISPDIPGREAG